MRDKKKWTAPAQTTTEIHVAIERKIFCTTSQTTCDLATSANRIKSLTLLFESERISAAENEIIVKSGPLLPLISGAFIPVSQCLLFTDF